MSDRQQRARKYIQAQEKPLVMSRGSKNHFKGQCRPCWGYCFGEGCKHGKLCNFCHYKHDDEDREQATTQPVVDDAIVAVGPVVAAARSPSGAWPAGGPPGH